MKVLVTGGTGYLGRAIVGSLMNRGHQPIVLARRVGRAADAPCPAIEGDVRGLPIVTIVPGVAGIIGADRIRSFSFVDDVAEAHVRALEVGETGDEYIAGGENVPQMRAFELLRAARGTPLPRRIPGPLAHLVAAWEETFAARRRPPRVTRGTVRILLILLRDWPLNNPRTQLSHHAPG